MYLVIKNGDTRKSYQCTNTCNKPRVIVSNSYIPLTNNIQSKPKCIINSMEIASYKSYTYTGEQGTITTGTTYLTRTETTGTTYQTRASTYNTVYQTQLISNSYTMLSTELLTSRYVDDIYSSVIISSTQSQGCYWAYVSYMVPAITVGYESLRLSTVMLTNRMTYPPIEKGTMYFNKQDDIYSGYERYSGATISCPILTATGRLAYEIVTGEQPGQGSSCSFAIYKGAITYHTTYDNTYIQTTNTIYETRVSTYNTLYGTRVSTSGTSYGTKTTNKTLTSSSWG